MNMAKISELKTYIKSNPMQLDVIMKEVYESLTAGQQGFTMFDGGSNKGWHAWRMIQLPGCGEVYAVEADPSMKQVLTDNLNKWHKAPNPKLHIVGKALQNNPEITEIPWMSSHTHVGRSSILASNETAPTIWNEHEDVEYRDTVSVPATTIDQILKNAENVPFLKLDLEGADFLALQGAAHTLRKKRPVIAYENSSKAPQVHGYDVHDIRSYFDSLGYIPLNYVGVPMVSGTWFTFHEAWAVPVEKYTMTLRLIKKSVRERIG